MRVVLDTNTVLSALVFARGHLIWLPGLWEAGLIEPLVSRETSSELIRVLAYAKFQLTAAEIETLLAAYLPCAAVVKPPARRPRGLPRCRDANDDMFLRLAAAGRAEVLVTGDPDLLALRRRRMRFAVETPAEFHRRF